MRNTIYICSPRQKRAAEILLKGPISVRDLGPIIGALNPMQVISEMRRQGFEGIILTRRFEVFDRDGIECHPGEYFIPEEMKPLVEKALREYHCQPRTKQTGRAIRVNRIVSGGP